MQIENSFEVPCPPEQAWSVLLDVPRIVGCVPGAELVSVEGDGTYKGRVSVKLGPVSLIFNGTASIEDVDAEGRSAVIRAKGADQRGRGQAGAVTRVTVEPVGEAARVTLVTDLQLSGMVAQYGRASGVIASVSSTIVSDFADCLSRQIGQSPEGAPAALADGEAATAQAPRSASGGSILWRSLLAWLRGMFGGSSTGRGA